MSEGSKISVVIRKRPINKKEITNNEADVVTVKNGQTVIVSEYKQKVDLTKYIEESVFNFDYAFGQECNNQDVRAVKPLVQSAFMGAKVTCFAYGQTGSGKTYTMNGNLKQGVPGLYILGAQDIFGYQSNKQFKHLKVTMAFFEIYCGKLFDLLDNRNQLFTREVKQQIHIVGLKEEPITTPEDFMKLLEYGSNFRVTSQNSTNADSSRSHAILQICLKQGKKVFGKISFIDLAGCQRGADHMDQNKQTRIDGAEINKSLLALKECIRALDQGKGHIPFRGSKLTVVLKDSFVGFCKTVMIGNISPNANSCENTLNTLRYADRVKEIKKGGNESLSKEQRLAKQLMLPRNGKNAVVQIMINNDDDAEDIMKKKQDARNQLGIRGDSKMTMEEPMNRMKNNSVNEKPDLKRQDTKGYNGYQNKNESLFDNCKTLEMRPKQNSVFNQQSQQSNPQNNQFPHPYGTKNPKSNNSISQNNQYNQNFNQNLHRATSLNQNIYQNQLFDKQQYPQDSTVQPRYNSQNYQQPQGFGNKLQQSQQFERQQNNLYGSQAQQQQQPQQNQFYQGNNSQSFEGQNHSMSQSEYNKRHSYQNSDNIHFQSQQQYQNQQYQPQKYQQLEQQYEPEYEEEEQQYETQQYPQSQQFQPQNQPQNQQYQSQNQYQPQQYQQQQPQYQQQQYQQPRQQYQPPKNNAFEQKPFPQNQPPFNQNRMMEEQFEQQPGFPLDWNTIVDQFKTWKPTNRINQLKRYRDAHEFLIQKLMQEEDQMTSEHSQTINREIETIKGEMRFIEEIEKNKAMHQSIDYANFIEDMLDRKLSALVRLKKRVNSFKEHLLQHQECEQKLFMAQEQMSNKTDELLLDNLESEY